MRFLSGLLALVLFACGDDSGSGSNDGPPGGGDGATVDGPGPGPDGPQGMCNPVSGTPDLQLEMVQGGFQRPLLITSPPGDPRLFVIEANGTIEIVGGGTFLDISSMVRCCGEQGLLGLAFHPSYASNRRFFVYYIDNSGTSDIQIDEFQAMEGDPNQADPSSRRQILTVSHVTATEGDQSNHNGGMIAFGLDGMLYASTGDGGFGDDPDENGQATDSLLGKVLRIDVDGSGAGPFSNYAIPAGNPLGDEIWALGLRNPWRFSFDRMTGDLYIGDVGQGTTEEVNVGPNAMAGLNFGWDIYEGTACHEQTVRDCATPPTSDPDVVFPVETVATGGGGGGDDRNRAIIGGYVYRGCKLPDYHGTYFYGTLNGVVRSLEWTAAGGATNVRDWPNLAVTSGGDRLSAFGQDRDGEVYVVAMDEGVVYKIVPVP